MKSLKIVMAQLNLKVGDLNYNLQKHIETLQNVSADTDIVVFPELSLTSYPPEDLLLRADFIKQCEETLEKFILNVKNIYCLIGHPTVKNNQLYNACSMIHDGKIIATYFKQHLPNYEVFDERRYFSAGNECFIIDIKGTRVGLLICEDLWAKTPVTKTKALGAEIILSPNASPFEADKHEKRLDTLKAIATQNNIKIIYTNLVGGQDSLVFDGGSMLIDEKGEIGNELVFFSEKCITININQPSMKPSPSPDRMTRIYSALKLSLRDYIEKNNFPGVLIGLSGGIDSALVLTLAVDALGANRVKAVYMPSRYSAAMSGEDAATLAKNLTVDFEVLSIEPCFTSFLETLAPSFTHKKPDITEENIQARIRAVLLMALSNSSHYLVLTTSNRSELAVGYSTLFGDMAGGFSVLKDIYKTTVYKLVNYRNALTAVIPERIVTRPPSAELSANQTDEAALTSYPILDAILKAYLNHNSSIEEICQAGFDENLVRHIVKLVYTNEFKRSMAPIGPRIYAQSFGKDWRYPITHQFRG